MHFIVMDVIRRLNPISGTSVCPYCNRIDDKLYSVHTNTYYRSWWRGAYLFDKCTLIPTYYNLTWCGLFKPVEIQRWYIQPKLNTLTVFGAEISSWYRPKRNRNVVEISGNECIFQICSHNIFWNNGTELKSKLFTQVGSTPGIKQVFSSLYYPWGHGCIENEHNFLETSIQNHV